MTNEEFIEKIDHYRSKSHDLLEGNGGYKIKRGMGHVISGYVEDLFALFLAKRLNKVENEYFVDKVTSMKLEGHPKAKSFKPDLAVIENNVLTHYFDLKTNMGWNRNFEEYLKEKNLFIEMIKGKSAWIRHSKKDVQGILIGENVLYQMVVIYGWNINQELLSKNLELAQLYKNVRVHILYHKNHENEAFELNTNGFNDIFKTFAV